MSSENSKAMVEEIEQTLGRADFPYDWDDVYDIPEEMLTIDNLLNILDNYKQKYNDALESLEGVISDVEATIDYYETREALGLG